MPQPSVTSTDSFLLKVQRSEPLRATILAALWTVALLLGVVRREIGGVVMSSNAVFVPTMVLTIGAILFQVLVIIDIRRFIRKGIVAPRWRWWVSAVIDLAIPIASLINLHFNSPRGEIAALSAPAILLVPLIILLSVMRLRPGVPLWSGLAAAVAHWALVADVARSGLVENHYLPLLATYGVAFLVTGIAGAVVAIHMKRYVVETLEEGIRAENAKAALAAVERDLSVARDIQRGLLPVNAPPLSGFDIAGMNRPADQTGGDYYDWQPLPDGRLAVVLADVTGHGIGPALVMAVCRAYSRASAPAAPTPAALLEKLNALIHEDLQGARFITMALALISPDGTVQLASAGHGPTLLYTARSNSVEWFGGDGLPLGVMPDERYTEQRTFTLEPGDILVLQTDGFIEWARASDHQQFGLERMQASLRNASAANARAIIESIDNAVRDFSEGSPQADDMTAVVIKRLPGQ